MRKLGIGITVFLATAVLSWAGTAGAQATDAEKCASKKHKEVGKYAQCLQKAESKALLKGLPPDYSKCNEKFSAKWVKIEGKAGVGVCPSEGDQTLVQTFVTDCADCVALALSGGLTSCTCSVDSCALAGGVWDGPACWFQGAAGESCDDACAGVGLVYDPATATYAGDDASGGTLANCLSVLASLGADTGTNLGDFLCGSEGLGCAGDTSDNYARCINGATSSTSTNPAVWRACACQEP